MKSAHSSVSETSIPVNPAEPAVVSVSQSGTFNPTTSFQHPNAPAPGATAFMEGEVAQCRVMYFIPPTLNYTGLSSVTASGDGTVASVTISLNTSVNQRPTATGYNIYYVDFQLELPSGSNYTNVVFYIAYSEGEMFGNPVTTRGTETILASGNGSDTK